MTINLTPELESRLKQEAQRRGIDAAEFASRIIDDALIRRENQTPSAPHPDQATLDLLAQWDHEDATDDADELMRRQREGEEFMQSLAKSRLDMEGPNGRKLWPPQS